MSFSGRLGMLGPLFMFLASLASYSPAAADDPKPSKFMKDYDKYLTEELVTQDEKDKKGTNTSSPYIEDLSLYMDGNGNKTVEKKKLGKQLIGILDDDYDYVEYKLIDFGDGKDLVVVCYEEKDDLYKPEWAMNLDEVCRVYAKVKSRGLLKAKAYLVTEISDGSVSSNRMCKDSALQLTEIISDYIHRNEGRCEDWKIFIQEHYGPTGPAE